MRAMARITVVLAALSLAGSVGIRAAAAPENISAVSAILIEAQTGTMRRIRTSGAQWRAPRK